MMTIAIIASLDDDDDAAGWWKRKQKKLPNLREDQIRKLVAGRSDAEMVKFRQRQQTSTLHARPKLSASYTDQP